MTRQATATLGMILGAICFAGCGDMNMPSDTGASDSALKNHHQAGSVSGPVSFGTIDQTGGLGACTGVVSAQLWTLTNSHGLVAKLTDFGATLVELHVPDKNGAMADIVRASTRSRATSTASSPARRSAGSATGSSTASSRSTAPRIR